MKKFSLLLFTAFLINLSSMAQSPETIVQQQLDFYNSRNIRGFMSLFSDDAVLLNQSDGKVLATGKDEVRKLYSGLFKKSPNLNSQLDNRMVLGNTVIDHERITGRLGNSEVIELIVIYEVKKEKIFRVTVIRSE